MPTSAAVPATSATAATTAKAGSATRLAAKPLGLLGDGRSPSIFGHCEWMVREDAELAHGESLQGWHGRRSSSFDWPKLDNSSSVHPSSFAVHPEPVDPKFVSTLVADIMLQCWPGTCHAFCTLALSPSQGPGGAAGEAAQPAGNASAAHGQQQFLCNSCLLQDSQALWLCQFFLVQTNLPSWTRPGMLPAVHPNCRLSVAWISAHPTASRLVPYCSTPSCSFAAAL